MTFISVSRYKWTVNEPEQLLMQALINMINKF